jgi:methionine-rich copper-binding protein CopC
MFDRSRLARRFAGASLALGLSGWFLLAGVTGVSAHARYSHAEPDVSTLQEGAPFVLRTYYTQELMSASTVRVLDGNGAQIDLGDGHVDLDDPDRKAMLVSLPNLSTGYYTVEWYTVSAEDGDSETGTFIIGVGMPASGGTPSGATIQDESA